MHEILITAFAFAFALVCFFIGYFTGKVSNVEININKFEGSKPVRPLPPGKIKKHEVIAMTPDRDKNIRESLEENEF